MGATAINAQGTKPHTILIIEDDEHLRQMTAAVLERAGFIVFQACDANEAAEIWQNAHSSIDLLFADIVMPGLGGPEIAREFREPRPDLKIIFASGNDSDAVLDTAQMVKGARFLRKPYICRCYWMLCELSCKGAGEPRCAILLIEGKPRD